MLQPATCAERGCCYHPSNATLKWCYLPSPTSVPVKTVHVVQGCHLDVGFVRSAPDIVNRWFDEFFPLAYEVGRNLSAAAPNGGPARLNFTAQSWLVSLYLSCPPGMGIHCPSPQRLQQFNESVANGWITWHAFPFNSEPEVFDASLFQAGVDLTHGLDRAYGQPPKAVMSQRDVPGMTRSVIPLLRQRGVNTISVGVNGGSTPPNVPPVFKWHDPVSNTSIRVLYASGGYGGVSFLNGIGVFEIVQVPGSSHALLIDWRGDNSGPYPSSADALKTFGEIKRWVGLTHPGATVVSSTFEAFGATMEAVDGLLPVVTSEIGDTWIHGVASSPTKLARLRTANRRRTQCLQSGACDMGDARVANFTRLLLKNGEHTWGGDQKTFVPTQTSNWSNREFQRVFPNASMGYQSLAATWVTQSLWGLDYPVQALGDHPLAATIARDWAAGRRAPPDTSACTAYPPQAVSGKSFGTSRWTVEVNATTGSLSVLVDHGDGTVWANTTADGSHLAELVYETYSQRDFDTFISDYSYLGPLALVFNDDLYDFSKVGINKANATHRHVPATLTQVWECGTDTTATTMHIELAFPEVLHAVAGAPSRAVVSVELSPFGVGLSVQLFNKTATRLPEAMMLSMRPSGASVWRMNKLGEAVDPTDVVSGAARHNHLVDDAGIGFWRGTAGAPWLSVAATDAGLVSWGGSSNAAFPTPTRHFPDFTQGASFILFDNIWNTNYICWITDDDVDVKFRFNVTTAHSQDAPVTPSTVSPLPANVTRGFVFAGFDADVDSAESSLDAAREMASIGAQWTELEVILWQANQSSSDPGVNKDSPTDDSLVTFAKTAVDAGLHVMFKVLLLVENGTWIYANPSNTSAWFEAYTAQLVHFAKLAESAGAEGLCIGTELVHLTVLEEYRPYWLELVSHVRSAAPSLALTYASLFVVEYTNNTYLWQELDAIGIDAYFPLWQAQDPWVAPTVTDLVAGWQPHLDAITAYKTANGLVDKPVWFTEIGYGSFATVAVEPSTSPTNCSGRFAPDFSAQAVAYEALFTAVAANPGAVDALFMFWIDNAESSDFYNPGGTNGHKWPCFFTPRGKPAFDVLKAAFAAAP